MDQKAYILPVNEIILCLNEVGIKAKQEDLIQPEEKRDTIKRIFEQLAEVCFNINREEINQPTFSGLQAMSYPELHEESIPQMNSFRILQQLMDRFGIKDFCLNDILAPSPRRLRIQLSYAVNFLKYRESTLATLAEHDNQRASLNAQLSKIQTAKTEAERLLMIKQQKVEEQADDVHKMETEIKEYENKIGELNLKQAEIRELASELKIRNNELKDTLSSKTSKVEELRATLRQLQGQIVSSPEKLKKQLDDSNQSLSAQHNEIRACEKKLKELNAWNECVATATYDISLAKEAIDLYSNELNKHKTISSTLVTKEQKIALQKDVLKNLQQNTLQLNRKISRYEEKNNNLKVQAEARAMEATNVMNKLQEDIIHATNVKNDVRIKVDAMESEVFTMKKLMESEKSSQDQVSNAAMICLIQFSNVYALCRRFKI